MRFYIQDFQMIDCLFTVYYEDDKGFKAETSKDGNFFSEIDLKLPFFPGFVPTKKQLCHIRSSFSQYSKRVSEETHTLILELQLKGGGCGSSKPIDFSPDTYEAGKSSPPGSHSLRSPFSPLNDKAKNSKKWCCFASKEEDNEKDPPIRTKPERSQSQ